VHEPVLVDAHIDERAERRDIGDDPFEDHAALKVADLLDAFGERRGRERRTRVAARFLQLRQDVGDRRQAERVVDVLRRPDLLQDRGVADWR
jgi:hypothetical protein